MTQFGMFCTLLVAFLIPFTLFVFCANNIAKNPTAILVNANVTKTIDRFEHQTRTIYHEYEYNVDNNTYIGACLQYFHSFQLTEALHFVNLTTIPVYVCENDVKKSRLNYHNCAVSMQHVLSNLGMIFGLLFSIIIVIVFFCVIIEMLTHSKKNDENGSTISESVKRRRRRITHSQ